MSPLVASAAVVIVGNVLSLLALWLRLRSVVQREHTRDRYLVAVARAMPEGGQLHERRADGSQVSLVVAHRVSERTHG